MVVGAALLHPPKSSSWAICGVVPQPGLFGCACDVVAVGAAGWLGAEEAQTSFPPHASILEKPEKLAAGAAAGAGLGATGAAGDERLKALFIEGDATGWLGAAGAGAPKERSRRSFMPDAEAAGFGGAEAAGDVNDEKSPKPLEVLVVCFCVCVGFGAESKKLPPPPNMLEEDVEGGDLVLVKLSKPAKGEGLTCGGAGCELKESPPKASFRPPKLDCCGDCCD